MTAPTTDSTTAPTTAPTTDSTTDSTAALTTTSTAAPATATATPPTADAVLRARTTLVLGGARSGKSLHAERLAYAAGAPVTYIATASRPRDDAAFSERIALHRERRPAHWALIEAGTDLAGALKMADRPDGVILLDCLTLWLTQLLCPIDGGPPSTDWQAQLAAFDCALAATRGKVIIVTNEIGMGVVPMGAITRLYVDELGRLNQRVAAACDSVLLTVAGLPMVVK